MTKKKNGIFSKIKNKFSKNTDESEFEDEIYEEVEDDFEESTDEFAVDPEALEAQSLDDEETPLPPQITEEESEAISFTEEQEEDDIEELLNSRSEEDLAEEVEEDDEEEFVAQEFKISEEDKEELEDLSAPMEEFQAREEHQDDEDEEFDEDYEDDFYEAPKPSVSQRFSTFLENIKDKVPSRSALSINKEIGEDSAIHTKLTEKFNINELSWTAFVDKVFSPDSRHDIHRGFLACMILGTAYFGGKLVATGISSKIENSVKKNRISALPFSPKKRVVVAKIESSNLFNTKDPNASTEVTEVKPRVDENLICKTSDRKTQLSFKLVNTIVLQDSVKSIASVQLRGNKILDLREGEKINNDAQVGKIDRLRVVFKNLKTGDCEYVENQSKEPRVKNPIKVVSPSKGKGLLNKYKDSRIKNVGNTFKIQKKVRDEMLGNISEVLTQARAIQIKNPDGTLAFKMTEIVPGSI